MKLYTTETIEIPVRDSRTLKVLVVRHFQRADEPAQHEKPADRSIGVLWLHGGGYETGFPKLVMMSAGLELPRNFNVTLFVPEYRLSLALLMILFTLLTFSLFTDVIVSKLPPPLLFNPY